MPDLAMLDYFYGDEAEQFTFYRIPKVLFTDPSYRRISSDAKILYGLMLDRMGLSVRNGWLDEYNRVFIFFTLEDALEYLCCGHTKAVSLFGELDKAGLIERKKQGQGKPTKIYVKNFVRNAEVLTSEKRKSKVPQSGSQDFQKTASNNTEIKDTELSDTEPSIYPARGLPEDRSPAADAMDTMRVYRQIIMENIEYDITRRQLGYDADILDEIVDIMVDTVCSTKPMIRIGGQDFPLEVVKSRLLKLNSEHTATLSLKGNKPYLFGSDIYANESTGEDYDIPGEALADPDFAALIAEAEKYLGFPYVWGGSSPSTSFDCSGFVCYVYTHSGVHNLPRTTAQGIYNQCAHIPMSEAKPGDIIFFTGTYNSPGPVSHVGIYVGNNMMIHCGSPIQYARTDSSYWSQHFYAIGRLN